MAENNPPTHDKIAKRAEDISMLAGVVSAAVTVGATIAAPTGLSAIAVAIGITSAPLVVVAAPIVGAAATVAGVVSSGTYFYAKWKNRQNAGNS
jgi:sugar (pentulose or hexulose) kinase